MISNSSIVPGKVSAVDVARNERSPAQADLAAADSGLNLSGEDLRDDLSREVYCILGMPIDVIDMPGVLHRIDSAAATASRLFLSTPNLNFLVNCQSDMEFRESLLLSDLSPADGMPIVWLGRLLGVPIKERVAGSDIFAALKCKGLRGRDRPLKLFLFGGNEGVVEAVSHTINVAQGSAQCVGWHYPGFFSVEELSRDSIIDTINATEADFLVVCLGSVKGQLWLKRNSMRLRIPVRAHFGASLNFEAGTVRRAPIAIRKIGLEWLWRIKEEPHLWKRYWHDGQIILRLLHSQVLPLLLYRLMTTKSSKAQLTVDEERLDDCVKLRICGAATSYNIKKIISALRTALSMNNCIVVNLTDTCAIDARFLGLLLASKKMAKFNNGELTLTGVSSKLERIFRLNGVDFLLAATA
jgi:N-acetylglucosaminyldiphosphoundecaprenol N-acetyl-beta-D-mannosaminyltransferase